MMHFKDTLIQLKWFNVAIVLGIWSILLYRYQLSTLSTNSVQLGLIDTIREAERIQPEDPILEREKHVQSQESHAVSSERRNASRNDSLDPVSSERQNASRSQSSDVVPSERANASRNQSLDLVSGERQKASRNKNMTSANNSMTHANNEVIPSPDIKVILFWTNFKKDEGSLWWEPQGGYQQHLSNCEYQRCTFTDDRSRIQEADMMLFKDKQMKYEGLNWPEYRSPNQLYVHLLGERPGKWHDYIKSFENKINLTMNYRKSADITEPFKELYKRDPPADGHYQLRIPLKNKTRTAIWPVSHCIADSKRQDYIKELSKYIDVDIYGKCGNLSCPRLKPYSCYPEWETTYKFYLSFENAICDDYITEKYYKPLKFELVPVVFSGDRYNSQTPPHEAIDARKFSSPRDLANFLIGIGKDEGEYKKYFEWKQTYGFRSSRPGAICNLCKAAHTVKNKPAHSDYYEWWFSKCDNGLVDRMRKNGGW